MKQRIRPLQRGDIPQVAALYELVMRSGSTVPAPGLAAYFERTVVDYPWVDPELPSLVYEEADGAISGFIGSHVRRFELHGEPVRIAYGGQLVAHPRVRHRAVGALLMQRYLAGAQEATITDTASVATHAMWGKLHGEEVSLGCIEWTRVFRPWRFGSDRVLPSRATRVARPVAAALDAVTTRPSGLFPRPAPPDVHGAELTPRELIEAVEGSARDLALRPAYDEAFLTWLFAELARVRTYGTLVRTILRDADGSTLGWYVYYLRPGATGRVLQLMAAERSLGVTLDHLFHHARSHGATALQGRLEPRLLEPLARRRCILRYGGGFLVHSRSSALLNAIAYGKSLVSRLDGEWWMGHHLESVDTAGEPTEREHATAG